MNNKILAKELLNVANEIIAVQDQIMKRLENKIQKIRDECGNDKELLKLKLFSLALKIRGGTIYQKRVQEEISKIF